MKTLKPLSEFILDMVNDFPDIWKTRMTRVVKYTRFLIQLLQLWMFIPCNKKGEPLEKPKGYREDCDYSLTENGRIAEAYELHIEYQKALDRIWFKGFKWCSKNKLNYQIEIGGVNVTFNKAGEVYKYSFYKTIKDLCGKGIELTPEGKLKSGS
jgi:hypothetical protein